MAHPNLFVAGAIAMWVGLLLVAIPSGTAEATEQVPTEGGFPELGSCNIMRNGGSSASLVGLQLQRSSGGFHEQTSGPTTIGYVPPGYYGGGYGYAKARSASAGGNSSGASFGAPGHK